MVSGENFPKPILWSWMLKQPVPAVVSKKIRDENSVYENC